MKATDIKWETDGWSNIDLPTEVEVDDNMTDDEIDEDLYDTYGWLVIGFALPMDDDDRDYFGEFVNEVEGKIS